MWSSLLFLALCLGITAANPNAPEGGAFSHADMYQLLGTSNSNADDLTSTYNNVSPVEGPYGMTAWEFKGVQGSCVKYENDNALQSFAGKSFTIATFFYQEAPAKNGPILEWRGATGVYGTHFWIWGGTLFTNLDPVVGSKAYHYQAPTTGTWRFVGVSYNRDTGDLYMWDEDQVFHRNTGRITNLDQGGDVLCIGCRPGQPDFNPFRGKLAALTLMKTAVTSAQIKNLRDTIVRRTAPFFGHQNWRLLTATPTDAGRLSRLSVTYNDVSLVEGPHGLTAWEFKGRASSYVKVDGGVGLTSNSFTIGTFFYQDSVKNGPILEWRGRTGIFGTHFWIWGGTLFTNLDPVTGASSKHWRAPTTGEWTFIGVSYDAETGRLCMWENDSVFHDNVGQLSALDQNGDIGIGRRLGQPTFNPFKGKLAGLTILDGAIKPSEHESFLGYVVNASD